MSLAGPEVPQDIAAPAQRASRIARDDVRLLGQQLDDLARRSGNAAETTQQFVSFTRQVLGALAVVFYQRDGDGEIAADPCCQDPAQLGQSVLNQLYDLAARAADTRMAQLAETQAAAVQSAIAVPVFCRSGAVEAMVVVLGDAGTDRRGLATCVQLLQFMAAYFGQQRTQPSNHLTPAGDVPLGPLVQVMVEANRSGRAAEAASVVANHLACRASAGLVAIGFRRPSGICRLAAISHQLRFERSGALVGCFEAVLTETLAFGLANTVHDAPGDVRATNAMLDLRAAAGLPEVYQIPLRTGQGHVFAACLVLCAAPPTPDQLATCHADCTVLGPHLALLKARRGTRPSQLLSAIRSLPRTYRRFLLAATVLAVTLYCTLPIPFRVKCACEVQPATRRYVTAPYQGLLETALVEPGDTVARGQLLARMDGAEVRKQLAAMDSERDSLATQRDIALANGEVAAARVAEADLAGKQQQQAILQERLAQLEIRSSVDGVVISGDLKKLQGALLTVGQTLLEVGPLDEMVIEVAIADHDISHVQVGGDVKFRLEAMPLQSFRGDLIRIHPRAESRESRNVFIGEVRLREGAERLRPGMRGTAKLAAEYRPVAWIVFHRAIEQALFVLGW